MLNEKTKTKKAMIKHINPLDLADIKRVEILPPYFESIEDYNPQSEEYYVNWIENNCKGRYYISRQRKIKNTKINNTSNLSQCNQNVISHSTEIVLKIGFENPKELSHFILACQTSMVK